jgi:hypothetical protein
LQTVHELNDELVIIPGRNDQADQWTRHLARAP